MFEVLISFTSAFLITFLALPIIIKVANQLGLVDKPDDYRKSHRAVTPSFGGIGIFVGFLLVMLISIPSDYIDHLRYILCALIIVFLVGAKDDLDPISPLAKLAGQLVAVAILVFCADIRLTGFYGLLGVYEIPYFLSVSMTFVFYIFLINSFNLIDGINGLASSVTILASAVLGSWFFMIDDYAYSVLAFTVTGSTLAFLKFNITPARIFMGDTGSLVLGTICAVLGIQFLEMNSGLAGGVYSFDAAPAIALSIFILPVFDTIRVFLYRLSRKKSPFLPDKNHIHHLLLDVGLSHMQATSVLLLTNVVFIVFALQFQSLNSILIIGAILGIAFILSQGLSMFAYSKRKSVVRSQN